jgi:hypothetical protein
MPLSRLVQDIKGMFGYTASLSLIGLHEQACFGCASEPNLLSHIIKFLTKTDSNNDGQNTDAFPSFALRTVDASQVQKWWSPTLRGKSKMLQALLSFLRQSPLPCSSARRRIRPPQPSPAALKTPPVGDGGIFLLGGRSAACRTTRQASEPVHGEARQGPQWSDPGPAAEEVVSGEEIEEDRVAGRSARWTTTCYAADLQGHLPPLPSYPRARRQRRAGRLCPTASPPVHLWRSIRWAGRAGLMHDGGRDLDLRRRRCS